MKLKSALFRTVLLSVGVVVSAFAWTEQAVPIPEAIARLFEKDPQAAHIAQMVQFKDWVLRDRPQEPGPGEEDLKWVTLRVHPGETSGKPHFKVNHCYRITEKYPGDKQIFTFSPSTCSGVANPPAPTFSGGHDMVLQTPFSDPTQETNVQYRVQALEISDPPHSNEPHTLDIFVQEWNDGLPKKIDLYTNNHADGPQHAGSAHARY